VCPSKHGLQFVLRIPPPLPICAGRRYGLDRSRNSPELLLRRTQLPSTRNVPHKTSKRHPSGHRITRTSRDRTRIDGKVGSCTFNADFPRVSKIETLFCASHFAGPKRARRWLLALLLAGSELRCRRGSSGPAVRAYPVCRSSCAAG
jgi:hypothetical protein